MIVDVPIVYAAEVRYKRKRKFEKVAFKSVMQVKFPEISAEEAPVVFRAPGLWFAFTGNDTIVDYRREGDQLLKPMMHESEQFLTPELFQSSGRSLEAISGLHLWARHNPTADAALAETTEDMVEIRESKREHACANVLRSIYKIRLIDGILYEPAVEPHYLLHLSGMGRDVTMETKTGSRVLGATWRLDELPALAEELGPAWCEAMAPWLKKVHIYDRSALSYDPLPAEIENTASFAAFSRPFGADEPTSKEKKASKRVASAYEAFKDGTVPRSALVEPLAAYLDTMLQTAEGPKRELLELQRTRLRRWASAQEVEPDADTLGVQADEDALAKLA